MVVDDCIMKGDSGQHSPSTLRLSEGGVVVVNGGGNEGWLWAKDARLTFKRGRGGAESRRGYDGWWMVVSGLRQPPSRVRAREGGGGCY